MPPRLNGLPQKDSRLVLETLEDAPLGLWFVWFEKLHAEAVESSRCLSCHLGQGWKEAVVEAVVPWLVVNERSGCKRKLELSASKAHVALPGVDDKQPCLNRQWLVTHTR